jgi:hypothetical protein
MRRRPDARKKKELDSQANQAADAPAPPARAA